MAVSLRLSDEDETLIKKYAAMHNMSISDLFRQAVMEKIEDEYDLICYKKAKKEFRKDSKTYSFEETMKELNLF